ncbi:hypothetical protein Aros01_01425 [Streptosporangium roseum]|uniref:Uncharacterized protein n=1 Tax=Streptosporangium roseum (strain ATCC 12428 / DSM 43021 / JCM 3005 / KCTC 9067 / NCIMB 10171 / NRRL 2505 / NI 9100) TaxID=479432 RepID=D2B1A5_STRRD|nr:hypothetical protein Sros_2391 [Streptosporangium roseum DSM 43021]
MVSSCLSLVVIAAFLWWSGAITPHIRWEVDDFLSRTEVDENGVLSASLHIELENEGLAPFVLTGISAEIPGLLLLPADGAKKEHSLVTVESGDMKTLETRIVITDCAAVPHEPQPVGFTYRTWMGPGSAEVTWDSWWLEGAEGRLPVAWQRGLAGKICNYAVSPDWP